MDWYFRVFRGHASHSAIVATLAPPEAARFNPLNAFLPSTLRCPNNTLCEHGNVIGCTDYYTFGETVLQRLIPSILLPFPLNQPVCILDEHKINADRRIRRITAWIEVYLDRAVREYKGNVECGKVSLPKGHRLECRCA